MASRGHNYNLWTVLLFVIISAVFVFSFIVYALSHPSKGVWEGSWEYLQSDTFKNLLPSFSVPLLIFVWGIYDKTTKDKMAEKKEERKRAEEEKKEERKRAEENRKQEILKREAENKDKRADTIAMTFQMWNQINNLVSDVRFCESKPGLQITDLQLRIARQSITFGEVIYSWSTRFTILPKIANSLFVNYTIGLFWGAWAVAYSIKNNVYDDENELVELQESLGIFQRGLVSTAFLYLVIILRDCDKLLDSIGHYLAEEGQETQSKIIDTIRTAIENNYEQEFDLIRKVNPKRANIYEQLTVDCEIGIVDSAERSRIRPINVIWAKYQNDVEEEIFPKILNEIKDKIDHPKAEEVIEERMKEDIKEIVLCLYRLKIYEIALGIEKFKMGEILPPFQGIHYNGYDKSANDLRVSYQRIKKSVEDPTRVNVKSKEYIDFLNSSQYLEFKDSFYRIKSTTLMTLYAADQGKRIKEIGRAIRFGRIILFNEDMTPVS
jgi:hypothetical protein